MRVIDLLNKIANGEDLPKRIECEKIIWELDKDNRIGLQYVNTSEKEDSLWRFLLFYIDDFNEEVEVIEENKKIKEIDMFDYFTGYDYGGTNKKLLKDLEHNFETLNSKINEIIDKMNKEK